MDDHLLLVLFDGFHKGEKCKTSDAGAFVSFSQGLQVKFFRTKKTFRFFGWFFWWAVTSWGPWLCIVYIVYEKLPSYV